MIIAIGRWLGNEERTKTLLSSKSASDRVSGEQLAEQLVRDGMIDSIPTFIFPKFFNISLLEYHVDLF